MSDFVTQEEFAVVANATLELLNRMKLAEARLANIENAVIELGNTLGIVANHLSMVSDVTIDSGAVEAARQRRENQ
tara:strand:+ start:340 stop:567 length:228 start_codon:yes stop_codon:yes gene_type:complete